MTVLGVVGGANGAAAVARGGALLALVTESLVRGVGRDGVPGAAIDAALDRAGVRPSQVHLVRWVPTPGAPGRAGGPLARLGDLLGTRRLRVQLEARLDAADIVRIPVPPEGASGLPGAAGHAAWAALSAWNVVDTQLPTGPGPEYPEIELHRKLGVAGLPRTRPEDPADQVTASLLAGHRVAWFAGGAEATPWTLGHRAVLWIGAPDRDTTVLGRTGDAVHRGWLPASATARDRAHARLGAWTVPARTVAGSDAATRVQTVDREHPLTPVLDALARSDRAGTPLCAVPWREPDTGLRVCTPYEAARAFREDPTLMAAALGPYVIRR